MSESGHYRIKTVARLTGIAPTTLRAWERRYAITAPRRTEGGHRLYADQDVALLRRLKAMIDAGVSIGEAVDALGSSGRADPPGSEDRADGVPTPVEDPFEGVRATLVGAFVSLDRDTAERALRPLLPLYPFEVTFERILAPTLVQLGALWTRGEASVAAEHFGTAFVREKLSSMLSAVSAPGQGRPRALLACLEGEQHELGLLYLALRLSARGWSPIYLGAGMPASGLIEAMRQVKPGILALSLTHRDGSDAALGQVARLCEAAGGTAVLVGGAACAAWRGPLEELGAHVIGSDEDLNALIRGLRADPTWASA